MCVCVTAAGIENLPKVLSTPLHTSIKPFSGHVWNSKAIEVIQVTDWAPEPGITLWRRLWADSSTTRYSWKLASRHSARDAFPDSRVLQEMNDMECQTVQNSFYMIEVENALHATHSGHVPCLPVKYKLVPCSPIKYLWASKTKCQEYTGARDESERQQIGSNTAMVPGSMKHIQIAYCTGCIRYRSFKEKQNLTKWSMTVRCSIYLSPRGLVWRSMEEDTH